MAQDMILSRTCLGLSLSKPTKRTGMQSVTSIFTICVTKAKTLQIHLLLARWPGVSISSVFSINVLNQLHSCILDWFLPKHGKPSQQLPSYMRFWRRRGVSLESTWSFPDFRQVGPNWCALLVGQPEAWSMVNMDFFDKPLIDKGC